MKIKTGPQLHLTYCLNVHPGESWEENFSAIKEKTLAIRDLIGGKGPFGLGLRLSYRAAQTLKDPVALEQFQEFLSAQNLYVFTVNGFPYGRFHGGPVKERVYQPDWRTSERLEYTMLLADILSKILPESMPGSISSVPCSYKKWIRREGDVSLMAERLSDAAFRLAEIHEQSGRLICIGLEPEPDCLLETTEEAVSFFEGPLRTDGKRYLKKRYGLGSSGALNIINRHLGICFDTAHQAVQFEDLSRGLKRLLDHCISVPKVQLSAGLRLKPTGQALEKLRKFCDPVYLHQVKVKRAGGRIDSWPDLPDALAKEASAGCEEDEWRVHFHVPLFFVEHEGLESTSSLLTPEFAALLAAGAAPHLEIETYTYGVLPENFSRRGVVEAIVEEYGWVLKNVLENFFDKQP
ncbi:MAG: metabolite traffic protein EboE [Nitrospinae bacterium]|nr:metabolite traffic protein EboE [Nitrospinota bacterium]